MSGLSASLERALTPTETLLSDTWQRILKRNQIGLEEDFFDLGGDSLLAALALSEIEKVFDKVVPMDVFFERTTLKDLAAYLDEMTEDHEKFQFLVPIKSGGEKSPLICVHTMNGEATTYHHMGGFMDDDRPVYGLRFKNSWKGWHYPLDFEQLAQKYAEEILRMNPKGPHHLMGYCSGGVLAFEIARVLKQKGGQVGILAILDASNKNGQKHSWKTIWINAFHQLKQKKVRELPYWVSKKMLTILRFTGRKFLEKSHRMLLKWGRPAWAKYTGKAQVLGWAFSNYQPTPYEGPLHYFEATRDKISSEGRVEYWKSLAEELVLIPMACFHKEISGKENSEFLSHKMTELMEDYLADQGISLFL
jgi:thioesterase domain-containing protein/acyl carrier protein